MSYLTISGKKIYYEEYGADNAPALVYLHGGPGESCLHIHIRPKSSARRFMSSASTSTACSVQTRSAMNRSA